MLAELKSGSERSAVACSTVNKHTVFNETPVISKCILSLQSFASCNIMCGLVNFSIYVLTLTTTH